MCAIFGALVHPRSSSERNTINRALEYIYARSHERGRDGRGYAINGTQYTPTSYHDTKRVEDENRGLLPEVRENAQTWVIGNLRAEPTTEFVADKKLSDQQPYTVRNWTIVHNGTIANDKELRTLKHPTSIDSAAIVETLADIEEQSTYGRPKGPWEVFYEAVGKLKGSYAILATHKLYPGIVFAACNYRPIWYAKTELGYFFASSRNYLPGNMVPKMIHPYTAAKFDITDDRPALRSLYKSYPAQKSTALVVCSGGLDSVVAATYAAKEMGMNLHLIHFCYGSRAEGPEVVAVKAVAAALEAELTVFPLPIYRKEDSPLLDADAAVAGGEAGAEFAHEWVPARNLVMLSVATAFAEARGIEVIVLGNNLEEAGAYPDNEPEFIAKFNDMVPFAVGDGKRMRVVMPVGNLMKHEIVALGARLSAPMHLTWSCYRAGKLHCGKCGPCFMRRKAFEINKLPEVIEYVSVD